MPQADRQRPTWFRPGAPDLNMRVSDADRAAVADRLARHYGDGRLDKAEFDERVTRAMAARTFGDLQGLFDDLPDLPDAPSDTTSGSAPGSASGQAPGPAQTPWGQPMPASCGSMRRRGHHQGLGRLVLGAILIIVAANMVANFTWHAMTFTFSPVVWLAIIAVIIFMVVRRSR
jgi:hypothetical protein